MSKAEFDFLAPPQQPDEIGRLGPFRVLKVLGKGGMGMVFKAEEPALSRLVALKIMLPDVAKKPQAKERFLREARAAAALEHDHIIPIYRVDEDRGVPYIAMPFLKGMTLDDWLKLKKPLTIPQIMRIGKEISKGLDAAHSKGLIHRDIKPANLWLDATANGRIKILDFGLARAENSDTGLTQQGMLVGTPQYMSPEQARGDQLDGRADLFSLGGVLYKLCTGQLPFPGDNAIAIITALAMNTPKHVRELNPDVPQPFADLIMKLLEKEADKRPKSAKEVVQTLVLLEKERLLQRMDQTGMTKAPVPVSQAVAVDDSIESQITEESFTPQPIGKKLPLWLLGSVAGGVACLLLLAVLVLAFSGRGSPTTPNDTLAATKPGASTQPTPPTTTPTDPKPPPHSTPPLAVAPFDAKKAVEYQQLWANHLGRKIEETNSIGMKLRLIPPGEFVMGSPPGPTPRPSESPQHRVTIARPFLLGATVVTFEQINRVLRSKRKGQPNEPVGPLRRAEALDFCKALSELPEEMLAGRRYRLPSEAEWEYACRAGTTTTYSFGDDTAEAAKYADYNQKPVPWAKPVGSLLPNPWGLFDMHGGGWQWCADDWHEDYKNAPADGSPWRGGAPEFGVQRGGSYRSALHNCRSAARRKAAIDEVYLDVLGLRVVCEIAPARAEIKKATPKKAYQGQGGLHRQPAFSRDGSLLGVASGNGSVCVWNVASGEKLLTLPLKGQAHGIAFSPTHDLFAASGRLGEGSLFDLKGKRLKELPGLKGVVGFLTISADGKWLASSHGAPSVSGGNDGEFTCVRLWNLPDGTLAKLIPVPPGPIPQYNWLSFSADGRWLAVSSPSPGMLWVFDLSKEKVHFHLQGHKGHPTGVAFAPEGRRLASCSNSGEVIVWDADTRTPLVRIERPEDPCQGIAWSPDGACLAVGTKRGGRLLDPARLTVLAELVADSEVNGVAFSPDSRALVLTTSKEGVRLYDISAFTKPSEKEPKIGSPTRFTNALGMEFALVPKGKAWLGGGGGKPGTQVVEFKDDFYLGVFEVTQEEWQKVMGDNPSYHSRARHPAGMRGISDADLKRFPVDDVSWDTCQQFVAKLNVLTKESGSGWTYRLPTQAEWEYACRGGPLPNKEDYGFDFYAGPPSDTLSAEQAQVKGNKFGHCTIKVGSHLPNRLGLHDLHGNVWEWCGDDLPKDARRAFRGGGYHNEPHECRVTAGNLQKPSFKTNATGLRVARVPAWQSLFNGKDLTGWTIRANDPGTAEIATDEGIPSVRLVDKGIETKSGYSDYHLRFEYKTTKNTGGKLLLYNKKSMSFSVVLRGLSSDDPHVWFNTQKFSFHRAELRDGKVHSLGNSVSPNLKLPAPKTGSDTVWRVVDVIRQRDSLVFRIDGVLAGAVANLRETADGEEMMPGRSVLQFRGDEHPAHFRNLEIRDITAIPPEVLTLTSP